MTTSDRPYSTTSTHKPHNYILPTRCEADSFRSSRSSGAQRLPVCINQSDPHERNHQVGLMRRVYQGAQDVVAWLGEAEDDSDLVMDRAGFVPALIVLIFGSAAAGTEFKLLVVLLLAIGLTAFCVALFIWGLGLPYPLLVGW